jgi:hypothetical protein
MKATIALLLLGLIAATHAQNLIVNGSFEVPALAFGANHVVSATELAPWQTEQGALLIWTSDLASEAVAEGRQHAEIVSLWQVIPTVVGQDYNFRFFHAARPGVDSTLSVELNGQVIRTFAENGSGLNRFSWLPFRTNFTATSEATTIRFNGVGAAGNAHIDNVVLERLPLPALIRVSEVEVCWETVTGRVYQVQYRSGFSPDVWLDLGAPVQGTGTSSCIKDAVPVSEPQRFYRVIQPE